MPTEDTSMATVLLVAVSIVVIGMFLTRLAMMPHKKRNALFNEHNLVFYIGLIIFMFGLYVCPLGTMELFQLTRDFFSLSFIHNYVLWIGIAVSCMVIGIYAMLLKRSPSYVKKKIRKAS